MAETESAFFERMRTIAGAPQLTPERMGAPTLPPSRQIDTTSVACPSMRQGDEVFCPRCSMRWDVGENRPECPDAR